jgi:RNA polymerase sigma-70 factor (ECF subfamily)
MRVLTDEQLVARTRRGSRVAAGLLFERHWQGAWRLAFAVTGRREAADDVAQEAFEQAFSRLSTFEERGSFRAWLHRIVLTRALNHRRREDRAVALHDSEQETREEDSIAVLAIRRAVSALPDDRRLVVVLRYWLDLTPTEISELLQIPPGTVHSRLARALRDLRIDLEVPDVCRA